MANAMKVRAKFKVDAIKRSMGSKKKVQADGKEIWVPAEMRTIEMSPVYAHGDPTHENSKFWAASPGGSLSLNTIKLEIAESFELGREYYIDFVPADAHPHEPMES